MAITNSTAEAMALLKRTRKQQLAVGRMVARDLIAKHGSTHSRAVRQELIRRGQFDRSLSEFWLGALFHSREFEWTGDVCDVQPEPGDKKRNIHDRKIVKVWTLRRL